MKMQIKKVDKKNLLKNLVKKKQIQEFVLNVIWTNDIIVQYMW